VETKASSILQFIHGLRGELHVTWEEGTWASWLHQEEGAWMQAPIEVSEGVKGTV
jgi:hypothetical protein